jgi:hypothetical protein
MTASENSRRFAAPLTEMSMFLRTGQTVLVSLSYAFLHFSAA